MTSSSYKTIKRSLMSSYTNPQTYVDIIELTLDDEKINNFKIKSGTSK